VKPLHMETLEDHQERARDGSPPQVRGAGRFLREKVPLFVEEATRRRSWSS
jgi:hypothetical protein